jgi:tRNA pseudouridine55 synthase
MIWRGPGRPGRSDGGILKAARGDDPRAAITGTPPGHPAHGAAGNRSPSIAHVSKGTYIRSLARDIALALGTVGHVTMLRRLRAGPFGLEQAISLDKLNEIGKGAPLETTLLLPLEAGLDDIPALDLVSGTGKGGPTGPGSDRVAPYTTGSILGAKRACSGCAGGACGRNARVVRGFNLSDVAE